MFVAKLAAEGEHVWSHRIGDASIRETIVAVSVDGSDNVVVAGHFEGTVNFGGSDLVSEGNKEICIAKLDADGEHVWSKRFGDDSPQNAHSVTVDGLGNVVFAGSFKGAIDFGGETLTSGAVYSLCVAKLDSNGDHLWSMMHGGAGDVNARTVATDGPGDVIVAGRFWGGIDLGGDELTTLTGDYDIFVSKLGR